MKKAITLVFSLLIISASYSQKWVEMMHDPSTNFYDIQKEFNKSLKKYEKKMERNKRKGIVNETETEIPGYTQYKRWEWFVEPRVYPSGGMKEMEKALPEIQSRMEQGTNKVNPDLMAPSANWQIIGPTTTIPGNGGGAGRLNCIAIDPANANNIWVGSPAGGIWKSINGGVTWTTNTDNLAVMGITDIAIDPTNSNIMYAATGDGQTADGGIVDTYSLGVLKSTDGGNTWNITGLSWLVSQTKSMNRVLINPSNTNILLAGTGLGVYRSLDAGATWAKTLGATSIKDMEFKPGDPNTVYATTMTSFYRSTNGGLSFTQVISGLPGTGAASRLAVAVTPADSNYVYVVAGNSANFALLGVYLSTNSGASFTTQATSPNLLGFNSTGTDASGQSWYTLSLSVSPINKNHVLVGGVNIWRSVNAGVNWTINAFQGGAPFPYVHADNHWIEYLPGSSTTFFSVGDGGFFKTINSGATWTDYSNGLQIAQMYRLGCSATNPTLVQTGWQDNGVNQWDAGVWNHIGQKFDGMETFVDYSNQAYRYWSGQNGALTRSPNNAVSWVTITSGITETRPWVTSWGMDPNDSVTLYCGANVNLFKSTNRGTNWSPISNLGGGAVVQYAVYEGNSNYIYVAKSTSSVFRTTNGGTSWTNISAGLPANSVTYVAVCDTNPDIAYLTVSGYNAGKKVYMTIDGGTTWTNISYDLPNIPVNCVVYERNTNGAIYVGTDLGVYYRNDTMTWWLPYNTGFPNVIVAELEIQYNVGKLRAATYGRGLWETNLFDPTSLSPAVNFKGDTLMGCPGRVVQFTDMSTNSPTSWSWTFPNGTPSSSTSQNPVVTYNVPGTYNDVKLVATNASGTDSLTKYAYVAISPANQPTTSPQSPVVNCGSILINASLGTTYYWLPNGQTSSFMNTVASGTYSVVVTDAFGCKDTSAAIVVTIYPVPATPVVTGVGNVLTCNPAFASYQWYMNSVIIPGATNQSYTYSGVNTYYVVVTDTNGCTKQSASVVGMTETELPGVSMLISPNPNNGTFELNLSVEGMKNFELEIIDVTGRIIYSKKLGNISGKHSHTISPASISNGIYFLALKAEDGKAVRKFVVE